MKKIIVSSPIRPDQLTPAAKETLTNQLYTVQNQIFAGVDRASFYRYVIAPNAVYTRIYRFENREGETIGYLAFHIYKIEIEKKGKPKTVYIARTETGVLKSYRGQAPISGLLFKECIRFWFGNGMPEAYFMATPIYPAPFLHAQRGFAELYPRQGEETPAHIQQIQRQLTLSLGLVSPASLSQSVIKVGWIVRQDKSQRKSWEASKDPAVQYFLQLNPHYAQGHGVMILSPGSVRNIVRSAGKLVRNYLVRGKKVLRNRMGLARDPVREPAGWATTVR